MRTGKVLEHKYHLTHLKPYRGSNQPNERPGLWDLSDADEVVDEVVVVTSPSGKKFCCINKVGTIIKINRGNHV